LRPLQNLLRKLRLPLKQRLPQKNRLRKSRPQKKKSWTRLLDNNTYNEDEYHFARIS
jgi:hypothetical protein